MVVGDAGRPLGVGEYFGTAIRRRRAYGFVLTENRFEPAFSIPQHEHLLTHFTCVLGGGFVETYSSVELECPAGSVLIVPGSRVHCDRVGPDGAHTLSIELSPSIHRRIAESNTVLQEPAVLGEAAISRLVSRLYAEFRTSDPASLLMLSSLALEILARAERTLEKATGPGWMPAALQALHRAEGRPGSSKALAGEIGVHEAHLARTFRRIHGCTVGEYLRWLKLEEAKRRLAESTDNLTEIALNAGFYDQAHFSREFRKAFGTTPAAYRKSLEHQP